MMQPLEDKVDNLKKVSFFPDWIFRMQILISGGYSFL